jgi:lipoate-protein ligase A
LAAACDDHRVTPRALMIGDDAVPGGPLHDVVLGPVLLAQGIGDTAEFVRIYQPEATAAFSRRDTLRPGFARATGVARDLGFTPVVRPQGGRLAAYHRGSVVIDHVLREPNPQAGLKGRFEQYAELHARVLSGFGLDARIGELPGEYCPGEHSVNAAGVTKIVGSAQRVTRDGWLFSSVIQVADSPSIREMLIRAHQEIGYELDPSTIGAMDDYLPEVTAYDVAEVLRAEYAANLGAVPAQLSADILDAVAASARNDGR